MKPHRGARDVFSPLLASLCALCPVLAQEDRASAVRESARVSIVEVPVSVIGWDGSPSAA